MAHRTKPKGKGAIRKWNREHKSGAKPLTDKDKNDIRKESETAKLPKKFKLAGESNLSKEEFNKKYGVNKKTLKKNTSKKKGSSSSSSEIESDANYAKENRDFNDATSGARKKRLTKEKAAADKAAKAKSDKEWLQKTSRSPAARAGIGDKQRLAARERHQKFKADRAKAKADRKAGVKKKRKLKITTWRDVE